MKNDNEDETKEICFFSLLLSKFCLYLWWSGGKIRKGLGLSIKI
jgi:hypothetical protein